MADNIVLDIQVKADEALKKLNELQATEAQLIEEQRELGEVTEENNAQWNAYQEAIKDVRREEREQSKVIQNTIKQIKLEDGSLQQLKAKLSNLTKEYNELSRKEREAHGADYINKINKVTKEIKDAEEAIGNYRRNVGNYKSALSGLKNGLESVGLASSGVDKVMKGMAVNPWIAIVSVLVQIGQKIWDVLKGNKGAMDSIKKAMDNLKPLTELFMKYIGKLAEIISNVLQVAIDWVIKSLGKLASMLDSIGAFFGADWHMADNFNTAAEASEEATEQIEEDNEKIKKSIEDRKKAELAAIEEVRRSKMTEQERELDDLKKAYDEKVKLIGQAKADELGLTELYHQKIADVNLKYENKRTKELADSLRNIQGMLNKSQDEQIKGIIKKYDDAIKATEDYTQEIEALQSREMTEGEKKRLAELQQLQFDSAQTQLRLEQQKQDEINAIRNSAAKKQLDDTIKAIDNSHKVELAKAKGNAEETAKIERQAIQERADAYAEMMNNEQLSLDDRLNAEAQYYLALAELRAKDLADEVEANKQALDSKKQMIDEISQYTGAAMEAISMVNDSINEQENEQLSNYKDNQDEKKSALKERLDSGLMSQKEYDKGVAALDAELEKKQKEIELKQAKREKAIALMNAIINTALGVSKAVAQSPMTGGLPGSAIAAAMGAIQIATIAAQQLPKASRGAMLEGPSHAEGGIPIEAEGGEAIINKRSTARFRPLLSAINEWGGGVKFANGGIPLDGGYNSRSIESIASAVTKDDIAAVANKPIYTTITDIRRGDSRYSQIQDLKNV